MLYEYQTDIKAHVQRAADQFDFYSRVVDAFCGGFRQKDCLEIGVGFHLPNGGLNLALGVLSGANSFMGIDTFCPIATSSLPSRVQFWKEAQRTLGVAVSGLNEGRVVLPTVSDPYREPKRNGVSLYRMSASDMFFRDSYFDLVVSNAVLEHLDRPREAVFEIYRVLRPGGHAFFCWNPFSGLEMGGHDLGTPFFYPWSHLRLERDAHIELVRFVLSDPVLRYSAFPPEHRMSDLRVRECLSDLPRAYDEMMSVLNRVRLDSFRSWAREAGFVTIWEELPIKAETHKYLTTEIHSELIDFSKEELLANNHQIVLMKPS